MGRVVAAVLAIVCAATTAGCGGDADGAPEATNPDVFFVYRMLEHGRQANEAVDLAEDRITDAPILRLAEQMRADIVAETPLLTALANRLGAEPPGSRSSVPGAIDVTKIDGARLPVRWMDTMVVHHRGAITIAETELAQGRDPEAKALAQRIVDSRRPRMEIMQGMSGG